MLKLKTYFPKSLFFLCTSIVFAISSHVVALEDIDYLPKNVTYDSSVPLPSSVLGAPVGEWHVRHDQLVQYMRRVSAQSPRMKYTEIGRTHENRPLLQVIVSSPENLAKLETLRAQHLRNWHEPGSKVPSDMPAIVLMGYSIHGDESSGSNSSLLLAYYLAAAQGANIDILLKNTIIILDPSLNPDGLSRFAQWANMHKGKQLVSDSNHREHLQGWPSARTNHYWADLNRDWLLLTHPESQARVEQYHKWRPHVLTDFHEMGHNSTYFFQPGVPSRTNPWTPVDNIRLTNEFAKFFSRDFDQLKRPYFTEESFDDFYYGKGSSYPDAHGSIGILFEQASSRGHQQDTRNGLLTFTRTIENQFLMSLATLKGAVALREQLLKFQNVFKKESLNLAGADEYAGYLISEKQDKSRLDKLLAKLRAHQIVYYRIDKTIAVDDIQFAPEHSYFIPLDQIQYRLIKSLFSERKRFNNNTFYDVSNWNIALAYNIQYRPIEKSRWRKVSYVKSAPVNSHNTINQTDKNAVAHIFSWQDSNAPTLLQSLLNEGIKAKVSSVSFNAKSLLGEATFLPGSVIVPAGDKQPDSYLEQLRIQADKQGIRIWPITTGLTTEGPDLGSGRILPIKSPKVLLVGGRGMSQYEVGEVWHYLDQQLGLALSIVDWERLSDVSLDDYSHVVAMSGNYSSIPNNTSKKIGDWLNNGGVLIGQHKATKWFSEQEWLATGFMDAEALDKAFDTSTLNYADREILAAKKRIAGSVYDIEVDSTHPLMYGFNADNLAIFKTSNLIMRKPSKPFITVASYSSSPLLAGYSSDEMQKQVANTAAIVAHRKGEGRVIAILDRTTFRGYWQGTNRILSNALYMSAFINEKG